VFQMSYGPCSSFRGTRSLPTRREWFPHDGSGLVEMVGWIVLSPLWSRWLNTGFTVLVLTIVLSRLSLTCSFFIFRREAWGTFG
jgi:hypothetical protein